MDVTSALAILLAKSSLPPEPSTAPVEVPTVQQIFTEYAAFVFRTLRRLGVADADVDDLCQDVFVVVHRKHAEFKGQASLRTWLYAICIHTASNHRRRFRARFERLTPSVPEQSVPPTQHVE